MYYSTSLCRCHHSTTDLVQIIILYLSGEGPAQLTYLVVSSSCPLNHNFFLLVLRIRYNGNPKYSGITSRNSPPFCMTSFSTSLTNLTTYLPQSHDRNCYIRRPVLAPPPVWLQKHTDLLIYTYTISHTLSTCDISLGSLSLPAFAAGDVVELILLYFRSSDVRGFTCSDFTATRVLCLLTKLPLSPVVGYTAMCCCILSCAAV